MFVDTSAFYALADRSDRNHKAAKAYYESIIGEKRLITTDHVLVECWALIAGRLGRDKALAFWDGLRSGIASLVIVQGADLEVARNILDDFKDQDFSLVDATSFAVMERLEEKEAFAFDTHFRVYRFGERRTQAFTVFPLKR
jgi:predicted nucleic acid-binding protein